MDASGLITFHNVFLFVFSTWFFYVKAVWSSDAFTAAVYTLRVVLSFACLWITWVLICLSTLLFFSEATGLIAFFVKCICNSIQVYCDSLVIKCLTESIWPRGSNHWSYGQLPSLFFFSCLVLTIGIIYYHIYFQHLFDLWICIAVIVCDISYVII